MTDPNEEIGAMQPATTTTDRTRKPRPHQTEASPQGSLPYNGTLPDPGSKRLARVSCALAPELKDAAIEDAKRAGETLSTLVETLIRQRVGMQVARGKPRRCDPLLQSIDELRQEAEAALSDGRISSCERARITRILSDQLHSLWGSRRTA